MVIRKSNLKNKIAIESLCMDLLRVVLGYHRVLWIWLSNFQMKHLKEKRDSNWWY